MAGQLIINSMGRGWLRKTASLYLDSIRWAWTGAEIQDSSSRDKVWYFVLLYGSWFVLMLGAAWVLETFGQPEIAAGIWVFGIGFSAFMASIDIAWETMTYLLEQREERAEPQAASSPQRELAWNLRPARDSWVGFVVTVIALTVLIGILQLSLLF